MIYYEIVYEMNDISEDFVFLPFFQIIRVFSGHQKAV